MTAFVSCPNSERNAVRNGEPPHSLSPYPWGLDKPLQTSVKCNGRPLEPLRTRTTFHCSDTPFGTRSLW